MSNKKTVVIEKDGVRAEATEATFKALAKRGWTVVDDGDKDNAEANKAEAEQAQKLDEQEQQLFGSDDKE